MNSFVVLLRILEPSRVHTRCYVAPSGQVAVAARKRLSRSTHRYLDTKAAEFKPSQRQCGCATISGADKSYIQDLERKVKD